MSKAASQSRWGGMGCEDGAAKPALEAALVGFHFLALLLKSLKTLRKRPFLMVDSLGSLGDPGAQPMGASGLLEGPPQTMAGP